MCTSHQPAEGADSAHNVHTCGACRYQRDQDIQRLKRHIARARERWPATYQQIVWQEIGQLGRLLTEAGA